MAILLTESYQRISTISLTYGEIRTYAKYNSQDNINAYTTYDIKATYYIPTQNYVSFGSGNLTVDGNRIDYGYTTIYKGETTLMEFQRTLQHENDGTSPIKNIVTTFNASFGGSGSTNADVQMPKIARLPVITSLENINDEQNPIIAFTNPAGFYLKAYFYRLSGYEFVRENVTSPYTFELTTDERNTIRQFMKNMQSDSVPAITIEAYSSSDFSESSYIGEATKLLKVSITNANPTVSLNVVETNQKVIDVYGGSTATTVVKNVSQLNLSSVVELKKYATLKSRTYTYNDNQTSNAETVTIVPTVNKVSVNVVDSRNLSASASKTLNMVDYLPIVINSYDFFRTSPTSSEIKLNADITYFQGTYNGTTNAPIIQYKMGANGTLRTLTTDDYTLDTKNNKITINSLVLEDTLLYTKAETFYLYVSDIFSSDNENDVVTKGIPTTERGEFDFQVNGDLFIADRTRQNKINVKEKLENLVVDNLDDEAINKAPSQRAVKEAVNKSCMLINLSDVSQISFATAWTFVKVPLNRVVNSKGDKFTYKNNSIKIGKNVSKIKITANFNWYNYELTGDKAMTIFKNGNETGNIAYVNYPSDAVYCSMMGFTVLDVTEGDLVSLGVASGNAGSCTLFANTSILVEEL